jgi:hypothetical protein
MPPPRKFTPLKGEARPDVPIFTDEGRQFIKKFIAGAAVLCTISFIITLIVSPTLYYVLVYDVPEDQLTVTKKPYDCDWSTAPLGSKHCYYERKLLRARTAVNSEGKPIVSYDEGKTWNFDTSPPSKSILIWEKVDD